MGQFRRGSMQSHKQRCLRSVCTEAACKKVRDALIKMMLKGGMRERESKVDFEITPRETIEAAHIQYTVWLKLQ